MSTGAPRWHRQLRRVEARYHRGVGSTWYLSDLGILTPHVSVPVWVYATWDASNIDLIGSKPNEYITLVDNTYVSSFAYNLAKIELGAKLFPEEDNYADLMVGNLKKYIAERHYFSTRDSSSIQWIIEYLVEYNGRNRALDTRLRQMPGGVEVLKLLMKCASHCLLMHELGHIAFDASDYRLREQDTIARHVKAVVGSGHGLERLEEEVFCDIFGVINAVGVLHRFEGWDPEGLRSLCLHGLLSAMLCIKTRDVVDVITNGGPTISLDPAQDVLMARHEITARAINETYGLEKSWFGPVQQAFAFPGDTLDVRARWLEALEMPVRDPETRVLATILSEAFVSSRGFDHVIDSINQIVRMSDLSVLPNSELRGK